MDEQKTLQAWRKERELTQFQLAAAAGLSISTITNVERLRQGASVIIALKLARALDVHVEDIRWPTEEELKAHPRKEKRVAA